MSETAVIRRIHGWLVVIAFQGAAPAGWRVEGRVMKLRQDGRDYTGVVLPVGSSNRIILRIDGGCAGLTGGQSVTVEVTDQTPDYGTLSDHPNLRVISAYPTPEKTFTIITLLRNQSSYARMLSSYRQFGFTEDNTEFLAIDNRKDNLCDGYRGVRLGLSQATGRYVIFCHDDVELLEDGFDDLTARLAELDRDHPDWMIAGVAGGLYRSGSTEKKGFVASRISDRWGASRAVLGPFPRRVESLDECFLVMPRLCAPQTSVDLQGFHFYGTDLCSRAELAGGQAFVIDFHLFHHGRAAKGAEYLVQKAAFEQKYSEIFPGRTMITTTQPLVLPSHD